MAWQSRRHRAVFLSLMLALSSATLLLGGERGADANRASKNGKVTGTIGGAAVTVEYGRPKVRGREIWGRLVPYGEVWRTGADEATTITFGSAVFVQGKRLPAGTYGLFTLPGEKEWQWIFNKQPNQWGAFNYQQTEDALRVPAAPKASEPVEELEFRIEGDALVLHWEKLAVPLEVKKAS